MIRGIDFVTTPVQDLERAVAFYRDILGLKLGTHSEGRWAEFDLADDNTIALMNPEIMGQKFIPLACLYLGVADVEATITELLAKGVTFPDGTEVYDSGVCKMVTILDSEGNRLGLHRRYAPNE